MDNKTVTSKFTELKTDGRKFHLKFSDSDMKFEIIEFKMKKKHWWSDKKTVEYPETIYVGTGEMYRAIAKQTIYTINSALREQVESRQREINGNESFKYILEKVEHIKILETN